MLLAVEEKLEGLKYNQDSATDTTLIWGDGVWVHRERDMTTLCKKGVIQWTYLNTFVRYCRFLKN